MAVPIANGDIYAVRVFCHATDQTSVNTIHYVLTGLVGGPVNDVDFLNTFIGMAAWPTGWKALLSDDAQYRGTQMGRIFPKPPTRPNHTIVGAGNGSVVGEILPRQVSGIISFQTDLAGPKYRGRLYIPFPSEASSDPALGTPSAAYVTALDSLAAIIATPLVIAPGGGASINAFPIVYHKDNNTYNLIVEGFGREKWATQRRRGSYGQPNIAPF